MTDRVQPAFPKSWQLIYQALADDIRERAGKRSILLVTHKGNWGDALIIHGARNFLNWHGIPFTELQGRRAIGRDLDKTLTSYPRDFYYPVFTAGGSISPLYGHVEKLRKATEAYSGGLILPASCAMPFETLDLHAETSLWVREHGESALNHSEGRFCHDMAFFSPARRFPKLRREGVFMRRDKERPMATSNEGLDLSALGSERSPVWPFFAIIGSHRRIKTNRLHVAVASAICGVPCELSPGATSKISDVFKASLSEYSPLVSLKELK